MVREIEPLTGDVRAVVEVPGSKSVANRALICAALAEGDSVITNASDSDDTGLMTNGLNLLGVLVKRDDSALRVSGTGGRLYAPKFPIPVGNAGTTFRFLLSLASLANGVTRFDASERMLERPVEDLLAALKHLGVHIERRSGQFLVTGGPLEGGGEMAMQADKSSQFVSSVLMVLPYARRTTTITLVGSVSSGSYIEMTIQVMRAFGVEVKRSGATVLTVPAGQPYRASAYRVEADASGATYFLAAAAICNGAVTVKGLTRHSQQGDAKFLDVLETMGCVVSESSDGVTVTGNSRLQGVEVDMNTMPDAVPTLAVTALFAESPTRITNIAHLRYKESDRLAALETELRKLGANVTVDAESLIIRPSALHGATLDTYGDHRLAMSFALAGVRVPGVRIENPNCVRKSFPNFWREFGKLSTP